MEVVSISPETDRQREQFLRLLFPDGSGYFCVAYGSKDRNPKKFREEFFKFPEDMPQILDLVNKVYQGHNVWFCPHLFNERRRKKENVIYTPCAWSDLDECSPEDLFISPTFIIESSPGRYQGLWMFETPVDPDEAENLSKRIAYTHAEHGADRSGWDLTQLLRFPLTHNYKYAASPIVRIIEANRKRFRIKDFEKDYEEVESFAYVVDPIPDTSDMDPLQLMENNRMKMSPTVWRLFQEELPKDSSWSEALWKLEIMLFEAGFDATQVFAIAQDAACNKYEKKGMPLQLLWKDVCRAKSQFERSSLAITTVSKDFKEAPLVSEEERQRVLSEDSFVERYITWAKSLGDAAPQYHQAGAFTALSALLSGSVQLPTSFGVIKPNMWFMILADTTLTRKSTAMDIAMDMVMEIDDDVIMATDGSIEGLLTSLSTRPSRPSVFLRDEFSGLLEMMTKKDYYAGMPELLTKLYDGKMQKRILRRESIEVRDPCLLVFAGGIKNKITELLTFEHVSSGFMPRFIFITAESDIARVRPLGPPTDWTDNNKQAILNELTQLYEYYNQTSTMAIKNTKITIETKKKFDAKLTPEAWIRYNEMETQMLNTAIKMDRSEIMTPVYDRLSKSILKAATLLAASRKREDPIIVEEIDIIRAMVYGEEWRMYVREVMDNIGKSKGEKELDRVYNAVVNTPGVTRSRVMQSYHLDARTASFILETLEQRGRITREKHGKSERLWPTVITVKEGSFSG